MSSHQWYKANINLYLDLQAKTCVCWIALSLQKGITAIELNAALQRVLIENNLTNFEPLIIDKSLSKYSSTVFSMLFEIFRVVIFCNFHNTL